MVKIGESVYQVERKSVSTFIQNVLKEENDILTEYLFKFGFYDDKTDSILFIQALKVIKNLLKISNTFD